MSFLNPNRREFPSLAQTQETARRQRESLANRVGRRATILSEPEDEDLEVLGRTRLTAGNARLGQV